MLRHFSQRAQRLLSVIASCSLVLVGSALVLVQQGEAAPQVEQRYPIGSPSAIRQSMLAAISEKKAPIPFIESQIDQLRAQEGSLGAQSIGAPTFEESLIEANSTWRGLTAVDTDAGGRVFVAWVDSRNDTDPSSMNSIYFKRSLDAGDTWGPAVRIDNVSGEGTAFLVNIVTDGNCNVYATWDDVRNVGSSDFFGQVFVARSRDCGETWSPAATVSSASRVNDIVDIATDPTGNVYIVWADNRVDPTPDTFPLQAQIMAVHSTDFGATWSNEVKISDPAGTTAEIIPVVAINRIGDISVGWGSDRNDIDNNIDLYTSHSTDFGSTWSADMRINQTPMGTKLLTDGDLCSDGNGHLYVFYGMNDTIFSSSTKYVRTSSDFGATFSDAVTISAGANGAEQFWPTANGCSFESDAALYVYEGGVDPYYGELWAVTTSDGGQTWRSPIIINAGGILGGSEQKASLVAVSVFGSLAVDVDSRGTFVAAWSEDRGSGYEGLLNYSIDQGSTWQAGETRFTSGTSATHNAYVAGAALGAWQGSQTNDRSVLDLVYTDGYPDISVTSQNATGVDTTGVAPGLYHSRAFFGTNKTLLKRHAGARRELTAIEVAKDEYPVAGSVSAIAIATSRNYPDGLVVSPLAGMISGTVLLNPPDALDQDVAAEILREFDGNPDADIDVYIVGGLNAIEQPVEDAINQLHPNIDIKRLAGTDRIETSVRVNEEIDLLRAKEPSTAFVTSSTNFPDALLAGAPGSDGAVNGDYMGILLNPTTDLDPRIAAYLDAKKTTLNTVNIVGGDKAISDSVKQEIDDIVDVVNRQGGANRFSTAVAVANFFYTGALAPQTMGIANGNRFPDALVGGRHSGFRHQPLLFVSEDLPIPVATHDYIVDNAATIDGGDVYGGTAVVTDPVKAELETLY